MVKVNLIGKCTSIQLTPQNGEPARCQLNVELDGDVASLVYHPYDLQLIIPVEFATLFLVGHAINITLDQW